WKDLFFWACLSVLIGGHALCGSIEPSRDAAKGLQQAQNPPVSVSVLTNHIVLDNGILQLTLSKPGGIITGLRYQGVDNLMETRNEETNRGYWDLVWSVPPNKGIFDRFILLRGRSGFYTYGIFEHQEGWPDLHIGEARVAIKLSEDKFHFMAIADDKQRIMPMPEDRNLPRGQTLAFKEAVRLVNPINPELKGEVDCKYQYSKENQDNKVHGWISSDPPIGFWQITPSDEFRTGGPLKQSLTSHVGPTTLAIFVSDHYAGRDLVPKILSGAYWKKVFGPVFFYLNSGVNDTSKLWEDAKSQMEAEVKSWPYEFPASQDFPKAKQRGSVTGRLLVRDRYIKDADMLAGSAHVGLAVPGKSGSWQTESKAYQFWTKTDTDGTFSISNVREGVYNVYAWVPGFIGDSNFTQNITITAGSHVDLGELVFEPPRNGPTLWEIGFPDRTAAEFYIPDPKPEYINRLYLNHTNDRFRQYGLWDRYTDLYPSRDLVYEVGKSDYTKDWFYAQVTRRAGNGSNHYVATTWQIKFNIDRPAKDGSYTLRIALASAARLTELQVWFNDVVPPTTPRFTTGTIGGESTIARHGIHGLYRLLSIQMPGRQLFAGENTIYLRQTRSQGPFMGIMYDYIRLEGPPS
ncbi:hypothetical protein Taro_027568, partial [Colocasia esculenta]|nr:hypothetical protein [Colocasia esculenta]